MKIKNSLIILMVELWHIHSEKYYTASEKNVAELNLSTQKDL